MNPIQPETTDTIVDFQLNLLKHQLRYLQEHSKFYSTLFQQHQIDVSTIDSVDALSIIPTITKKDLQKHGKDFWCVGAGQIVDYVNTTGTESNAMTVPLTDADLDRLALNEFLSFQNAGCTEDDIFQLTTTVDKRFMAGLAYVMGARKLGAGMVRLGPGLPQLQWDTIAEIQPTVLIVVPSFLMKMIEFAEKNGIDFRSSSVKKAICIGEPIRNADLSPNVMAQRIVEKWDIQLFSTYASTEMATAFTECEAGKGGHVQSELIIAEVLDDEGNKMPDGVPGELTITTLGIEGFPLLRYRTGDICAMFTEPCSCGRTTPRVGPVLGRKNQMIKTKGTSCYPQVIFNVLDSIPEITAYQVELASDELLNDVVKVKYALNQELHESRLVEIFKSKVRFTPVFEVLKMEDLQQLIHLKHKRKPFKLIDKRAKKF